MEYTRMIVRNPDGSHYDTGHDLLLEVDFGGIAPMVGDLFVTSKQVGQNKHEIFKVLYRAFRGKNLWSIVMEAVDPPDDLRIALGLSG
jgi:hypothetical protein